MFFQKKGLFASLGFLIVLVFAFTLTGCPMTKTQSKQPKAPPQDRKAVTEKVDAVAARVTGVQKAYTVILGNTALVGVELENPKISKSEMLKMERAVGKRVIKEVNVIKTVYATAAPDVVERIKDISQKVNKGEPVNKFSKDINDIIRGREGISR